MSLSFQKWQNDWLVWDPFTRSMNSFDTFIQIYYIDYHSVGYNMNATKSVAGKIISIEIDFRVEKANRK